MGAVTGLEYLHEHNIVHGDLMGVSSLIYHTICADTKQCRKVNILMGSGRCARLANFGVAAILDETTTRTTSTGGDFRGMTRWMAPELIRPEQFGFTGKLEKRLPSKDTDIYAIGMTIFEVSAPPFPSRTLNSPRVGSNGMCSVCQRRS